MEKKSVSASYISMKLILEYINFAIIFGSISYIFIITPITFIKKDDSIIIARKIVYAITTFLYVWKASKNVLPLYVIIKDDISKILRNVCIFFLIIVLAKFIINFSSYQRFVQIEFQKYRNSIKYEERYEDTYYNSKEKQQEEFEKKFYPEYGDTIVILTIYDATICGIMILLQKKWLLKASE